MIYSTRPNPMPITNAASPSSMIEIDNTNPTSPHLNYTTLIEMLLTRGACNLSSLTLRPSSLPSSGLGIFAVRPLPHDSVIARIPRECVVTGEVVEGTRIGRIVVEGGGGGEGAFFAVLAGWKAGWKAGCDDGEYLRSSFFREYIRTLPTEPQGFVHWGGEVRKLARGTSLHANCEKVITELEELYQKVLGILERAGEGGEEGGNITAFSEGNITTSSEGNILSREDFFWAHDMYYSRRYPTRLLSGIRQSNTEGMLVPFLDRLNHRANEKVLWEEGGEEGVGMRVGGGRGYKEGRKSSRIMDGRGTRLPCCTMGSRRRITSTTRSRCS